MAQQNAIEVKIPEKDLAEIRGALGVLSTKLAPHLASLNTQDRMELPKMGDRTVAFVRKAYEYGIKHKDLMPPYMDIEAMEADMAAVDLLREFSQTLNPLRDALDDSLTLSGSEAYQGALLFYTSVKAAAKAKAPNAISVYEDLSARFPGASAKKKA